MIKIWRSHAPCWSYTEKKLLFNLLFFFFFFFKASETRWGGSSEQACAIGASSRHRQQKCSRYVPTFRGSAKNLRNLRACGSATCELSQRAFNEYLEVRAPTPKAFFFPLPSPTIWSSRVFPTKDDKENGEISWPIVHDVALDEPKGLRKKSNIKESVGWNIHHGNTCFWPWSTCFSSSPFSCFHGFVLPSFMLESRPPCGFNVLAETGIK